MLDLYERRWEGELLHPGDYVVSADEPVDNELDADGELLSESRHTSDGKLFARIEYEYDDDGELAVTRELDGDGNVLSEWDST